MACIASFWPLEVRNLHMGGVQFAAQRVDLGQANLRLHEEVLVDAFLHFRHGQGDETPAVGLVPPSRPRPSRRGSPCPETLPGRRPSRDGR